MLRAQRSGVEKLSFFFFVLFAFLPFLAHAAGTDIGFSGSTQDIFFSSSRFIVDEPIRIYSRVHNFGDVDMSAQVVFYQGSALIGEPQVISIRAKGLSDEVYVDWKVPDGSFNIRAEVKAHHPRDENPANDIALTALITPEKPAPPPPPAPSVTPPVSSPASGGGGKIATSVGSIAEKKGVTIGALIEEVKKTVVAFAPPLPPTKTKANEKVLVSSPAFPAEDAVDSVTSNLLKVSIDVRQKHWHTFRFSADVNRADGTSYEWSFGDGKTERGKDVTHTYTFAGRYVASVVAMQDNGERAQEKVTLDISFWNLDNWQLWLVLLLLIGFVVLLLGATRQEKKQHPEERSAVEEGDLPPVILASEMDDPTVDAPPPVPKKKRKPPVRRKKVVKKDVVLEDEETAEATSGLSEKE